MLDTDFDMDGAAGSPPVARLWKRDGIWNAEAQLEGGRVVAVARDEPSAAVRSLTVELLAELGDGVVEWNLLDTNDLDVDSDWVVLDTSVRADARPLALAGERCAGCHAAPLPGEWRLRSPSSDVDLVYASFQRNVLAAVSGRLLDALRSRGYANAIPLEAWRLDGTSGALHAVRSARGVPLRTPPEAGGDEVCGTCGRRRARWSNRSGLVCLGVDAKTFRDGDSSPIRVAHDDYASFVLARSTFLGELRASLGGLRDITAATRVALVR